MSKIRENQSERRFDSEDHILRATFLSVYSTTEQDTEKHDVHINAGRFE